MDDRELLELAARAAGIALEWRSDRESLDPGHQVPDDLYGHVWKRWDPLLDDGDAMRLAVRCGMGILYETQEYMGDRTIEVSYDIDEGDGTCKVVTEVLDCNPCAATRRAIVRAAAEIGRAMS